MLPRALKPLAPSYRLAQRKREFEQYLRSQGWSKKEAQAAVAKKFGRGQNQP